MYSLNLALEKVEEVKREGEERGRMAETPQRCDGERIGLVFGGPETLDPEVLNSAFGLQQPEQDDGRALGQEKQSVPWRNWEYSIIQVLLYSSILVQ